MNLIFYIQYQRIFYIHPTRPLAGMKDSERQMVAFLPDALSYEYDYPISIMKITPLNKKFAEKLSHRDVLGSIMNLGIERCKMGDILMEENAAILFVQENLADYLAEELTRIRHTSVMAVTIEAQELNYTPELEEIKGTVASVRLDSLLSIAFSFSRSKLTAYIEGGRVYVNGKLITTNSYNLCEGDIVSVRGLGRFRYDGLGAQTKKGRYYVTIQKYI